MILKKGLLMVAIVLSASLATMAMVSNPAFAGTGFSNRGECINYLLQHGVPANTAAKLCKGPFAG
jgi:hypothetical protein